MRGVLFLGRLVVGGPLIRNQIMPESEGSSELCALGGREIKELTIHYVLFLLSLNFDN